MTPENATETDGRHAAALDTPPADAAEAPFDRIVVIFNPNSTGEAPKLAEQ